MSRQSKHAEKKAANEKPSKDNNGSSERGAKRTNKYKEFSVAPTDLADSAAEVERHLERIRRDQGIPTQQDLERQHAEAERRAREPSSFLDFFSGGWRE